MYKKVICIAFALLCIFSLTTVNAATQSNFIDLQAYNEIYKMSEESDVSLPFIKVFSEKAIYDKPITKSGLSIASKGISTNQNIGGVQTIISNDTVQIDGTLEYAVIMATNVEITGTISKDVLILAESVFITDSATIGGDAIVMAKTTELKGNVVGNFIANSSSFLMNGTVGKDFRVRSENIEFNNYTIGGNIYVETNSDVNLSEKYPEAVVAKFQTNVVTKEEKTQQTLNKVYKCVIAIALFTITNMIIKKINPNLFTNMANKVKNNSTYAIILGVLSLVTIPLVIFLLVILSAFGLSAVTMPLFVAYIALIIITISLAKFITGSVLYEYVKEKAKVDTKLKEIATLIGIFAGIYILCNIPYIAGIMTMATVLFSAASVITAMTKKNKE